MAKKDKTQASKADIDGIAENYHLVAEKERTLKKEREIARNHVMSVVEQFGTTEGKQTFLRGDKWEVGFTTADQTPVPSVTAIQKLAPKLVKQLLIPSFTVNTEALESLIREGAITNAEAKEILLPPTKAAAKTVFVKKITL